MVLKKKRKNTRFSSHNHMHKNIDIGFFTIFSATTHGSLASGHSFRSKGNNFRSYLCKVCPPCSRPPSRPSLSPSSPASWAPSSPAWRVSSWSWSPPAWACRCGWPRQSSGAGTCPPCRRGASWAAPAAASRSGRSSALRTRGSEQSNIIVILHILTVQSEILNHTIRIMKLCINIKDIIMHSMDTL